jgi:hypothetical protein
MSNRRNATGYTKSFALSIIAVAICALVMGAAVLAPAGAASGSSTTEAYAEPADAFPDQFVNQPEQIMMMIYSLED